MREKGGAYLSTGGRRRRILSLLSGGCFPHRKRRQQWRRKPRVARLLSPELCSTVEERTGGKVAGKLEEEGLSAESLSRVSSNSAKGGHAPVGEELHVGGEVGTVYRRSPDFLEVAARVPSWTGSRSGGKRNGGEGFLKEPAPCSLSRTVLAPPLNF